MNRNHSGKVISLLLCVVMLFSLLPVGALAADWNNVVFEGTSFGTNGYYNVISQKEYTLVPGAATETEMVINNSDGSRRQVMHVLEVDPSNPDVSIVPGYYGIDKDLTDVNNWKPAGVTEIVKYYEDNLGYNVVGAMNTALAYDCDAPYDWLVYNGQVITDKKNGINSHHSSNAKTMLCVYKNEDGSCYCELRTAAQGLRGDEWQAVGANFDMTVKDGVLVSKTEERTSSTAARSMVGVKEDGTLVLVMNDGRGANNSIGFNNYELGESMLALGCKWAFNCDGGGSSSFVTKRAGETVNTMRCVPCDGAERPTLNAVLITSNVGPTGELNNVDITSGYDYFAPGTTSSFGTSAIDTHGYAMDLPADASWALSDDSFGTIANGTFVSNGTLGDVDVQVISGGNVVGSKTIHVANPESLTLSATSTTLPYSTADKPRMITLPIVAKVGEADVFIDASVFEVTSSVEGAGTLNGLSFTATTDESVAGTKLTAKYLPTGQTLEFTVSYGKGSEILWDFEDGDISNWYGGSKDVKGWLTENGVAEADQLKTLISGGQISFSEQSHTFLSTRENGGQVHNGNSALGVTFDFRNVEFNSWVYALLFNVQDQYVLRDVANGKKATALGMWCYVPEGFCNPAGDTAGALAMQLTVYKNPQGTSGTQLNFQFYSEKQKKKVSLNQCTEADIPENRWVYLTADLTGSDYYSLTNPKGTGYREPSFFRMYIKPTRAQELTYYFDDFTLDYSSAVDDRNAPVITNPTYCLTDTNIAFDDQPISTNVVSFDANIADYAASNAEGLNYASAAIYADGVKLDGVTASGSTMGVKNVKLSDGTHAIKFEIYDNAGNFSSVTKSITVDADASKAVVTLAGHNDKGNVPESDSVYYADLVASDIQQISNVTATLKLNTANTWELDHMIAAPGFEASYTYNEISKLATVTVTKVGDCALTGEQTLVSIPARVWSFDESTDVGGDGSASKHMTAAERFNSSYGEPKVFVDVSVVSGAIGYADNTNGTFGGSFSVATKLTGNKSNGMWHQHTAAAAEDKAATCVEAGYTGRTYCDECGSVVEWGTVVPAQGHDYQIVDGKFVCQTCGNVYQMGTGLFEINGKNYYAIGGNLVSGWVDVEGEQYYFDKETFEGINGVHSSYEVCKTGAAFEYSFTNGKLDSGVWVKKAEGTRYYYGSSYVLKCMREIDGKTYGFDANGYRYEGLSLIRWNPAGDLQLYEYTDDGVYVGERKDNGVVTASNGKTYYCVNGAAVYAGVVYEDGFYYYFNGGDLTAAKNCTATITKTNGLLPYGVYTFDEFGHIVLKQGLIHDEDGEIRYYVDGQPTYAGLVQDTDGSYYYISGDGNKAVKSCTRYISEAMANSLLPAGTYSFLADGKMDYKQGLMHDADGEIRYYVNGLAVYAGLVQDTDGSYYYISGDGNKAVKSCTRYVSEEKANGLLPAGTYSFLADGKLDYKQGLTHDADGEIRYYVNGAAVYAGLVQDTDGSYYYISGDGNKAVKSCTRYVSEAKANGLLPAGNYTFLADGKMDYKQGLVHDADGEIRYYVNGAPTYAGLVQDSEGYYYYISGDGNKAVKNVTRYVSAEKANGLLPAGTYTFLADGKMDIKQGVVHDPDGNIRYYVNGTPTYAGLVQDSEGYYYYISGNGCIAVKNCTRYIADYQANGLLPAGMYQFDEFGHIVFD